MKCTISLRSIADCMPQSRLRILLAIAVVIAVQSDVATAQPGITLTSVGSPIWRPADFQLFTAPADPFPDAFFATLDLMLPLEGPGAAVYTPHQPPYNTELSTNRAAAGIAYQTVFPQNAITLNPNGVYLMMMWLPDPGVIGSSRDFASGPVIPNSLFPFTSKSDIFLGGVKVETLQDQLVNIRNGDVGFTGASHRAPSQVVWHPWADDPNAGPLGNYEIRWQLRDIQGNGWNIVAAFQVVPEPCALSIACVGAVGVWVAGRRKKR
jgi:hypothetical protein